MNAMGMKEMDRKEIHMKKTNMEEIGEKRDKISVIVPCYNEEESLAHFYEKTALVLEQMDVDYELLFVDDGSSDKTLPILRDMRRRDSHWPLHFLLPEFR